LAKREFDRPGEALFVIVVPVNRARRAIWWVFPRGAVLEEDAGQHKGASSAVFEVEIRAIP
jgi:hypothetical protein